MTQMIRTAGALNRRIKVVARIQLALVVLAIVLLVAGWFVDLHDGVATALVLIVLALSGYLIGLLHARNMVGARDKEASR